MVPPTSSEPPQARYTVQHAAPPQRHGPLRVLHVYSGNLYGGVERMLATLSRHRQLCPDMQPAFALCYDGKLAKELRATGAPLEILGEARLSRPWTVWRARRKLATHLERHAYDVLVTHDLWSHRVLGSVSRRLGTKLAVMVHTPLMKAAWHDYLGLRIRPDRVIANSVFTGSTLTKIVRSKSCWIACVDERSWTRWSILYPPVAPPLEFDSKMRAMTRAEEDVGSSDSIVIICASRMQPLKGHVTLLKALAGMTADPRWVCWLVGGAQRGPEIVYERALHDFVRQSGMSGRVRFLGQRDDVSVLLDAADIYCQPNLGPEAFGLSLVEAMYSRKPIVTTDLGAAREVLGREGSPGLLVPADDPERLRDVLRQLITDPLIRETMGAKGPARASAISDVRTQQNQLLALLL